MAKGSKNGIYSFDRFKLDGEKLMLYRDEIEIMLQPKIVKTLAVLVENRGSILSKDELIEKVWDDSIVAESNLSQNLYILRKTLGSKPGGGQYIETLRRRGYRFTGDVYTLERPLQTVNGNEADATRSQIGVERQGNVLRLVDWAAPAPIEEPIPPVPETAPAEKRPRPWYAVGVVVFIVIATTGAALYLYNWGSSASDSEKRNDLTITPLTNGNYVHDATVSPDGNFFVYNEELGETSRVWLQQTGKSSRFEIIPGGKWQVCCKTFTRDGKFIYFLVLNTPDKRAELYRVPTLGGTPEKILTDVNTSVSFSPDGSRIVFNRSDPRINGGSIVVAGSDGKVAEQQIVAYGEQYKPLYSAWSPDGKKIAFASLSLGERVASGCYLYTFDLDTGAITPIADEQWSICHRMEWLRDGSGIVMIGTRLGESNTARRDHVYLISYPGGESRRLTTDVSRYEYQSLGVTDDGSILAVPFNRSSQIWGMNSNGDSRTAVKLTSGVADGRGSIAPLPDGRVGYTARSGDDLNIWIMDADGSNQKQIGEAREVQDLTAMPDGLHFIYSTEFKGRSALYRMRTDGTDPIQITSRDDNVIDSVVSPDGTSLVYDLWVTQGHHSEATLKKMPVSGGQAVTLISDNCSVPHFSPDGRYVSCVYFSNSRVAMISADDGTKVSEFDTVRSAFLNSGVHWTPDGRALVYIVHQNNVCNLWKQPINGGKPEPLTDFTNGSCYSLDFSWDGTQLYVARGDELRDAVLITNYK